MNSRGHFSDYIFTTDVTDSQGGHGFNIFSQKGSIVHPFESHIEGIPFEVEKAMAG